jgi:peptidoglycan hydrolase-like protein with peptidoglycan-binding domain
MAPPAPATNPTAPTVPALDETKVQDADSRAIEEIQSRRDRPTQEATRPEEPKKTEEQLKAEAEQAEAALKLGTRDRQKIQVALTSLGFDAGGADGVFGPRTRTKIADWQSANGEPPTGFISADNKTTLFTTAAPAIARWEEAMRRAYLEEQRRLEELRRQPPPPPPKPARTWRWPWEERQAP